MKNKKFFFGKRVLVTGYTGFVGSWICLVLEYLGAEVFGIALEAEEDALYNHIKEELKLDDNICDLRDFELLKEIIKEIKPTIVIHAAAYGFVKECAINPQRAFDTNTMGTVNLFEALRQVDSVRSILVISSDKVYRNIDDLTSHSFLEGEPIGGIDPYSASKTCEDLIAESYAKTFFCKQVVSINIVRPGNILGGGDHIKSRLLPSMIDSFSKKKPVSIRHPYAVRPWQHVLDAVDAYLSIIESTYEKGFHIDKYNVGPGGNRQMSVGEIAEFIGKKIDEAEIAIDKSSEEVKESGYLDVDISKIITEIGWHPIHSIEDTLNDVFSFWEQSKNQNTYEVCRSQIINHFGKY